MCYILLIHSLIDGHLCCFHLLATVNSAAMNIRAQVFLWMFVFTSLGIYLGELLGHMIPMFNLFFFKKLNPGNIKAFVW